MSLGFEEIVGLRDATPDIAALPVRKPCPKELTCLAIATLMDAAANPIGTAMSSAELRDQAETAAGKVLPSAPCGFACPSQQLIQARNM